jgi:hypothetical protein
MGRDVGASREAEDMESAKRVARKMISTIINIIIITSRQGSSGRGE